MLTFFSLPYLFKRKIVKVGFKFFVLAQSVRLRKIGETSWSRCLFSGQGCPSYRRGVSGQGCPASCGVFGTLICLRSGDRKLQNVCPPVVVFGTRMFLLPKRGIGTRMSRLRKRSIGTRMSLLLEDARPPGLDGFFMGYLPMACAPMSTHQFRPGQRSITPSPLPG